MTSKERVMKALNFQRPDRIPTFEDDIQIVVADESPFPSRVETISEDSESKIYRDGWGSVVRTRSEGYFYEELDYLIKERSDLDKEEFDSPYLDSRYGGFDAEKFKASDRCIFCKTGGPYIRSSFIRGKANFLMDIAGDPSFAKALTDKVADHLIEIGKESLRRGDLYDTGLWIYDDMGNNLQPMMSPTAFEKIFLPAYKRMVKSLKEAGAAKVCLHSDGNIMPILDMLVDAGIDGIHPVECKAGMSIPALKAQYGDRLAFIGGMCNARILPRGTREEIEAQAREIIAVARDGGVIIGTHSIGDDVSKENYDYYHQVVMTEGVFE